MSLYITKRPQQINPVANPVVYRMVRKDYLTNAPTNSGGKIRFVVPGVNLTATQPAGSKMWYKTDDGTYNLLGTVFSVTYSAPDTTVTLEQAYTSAASAGYVNIDSRIYYNVNIEVYDSNDNLIASKIRFVPDQEGNVYVDVAGSLRQTMKPDNESLLVSELFDDTNVYKEFYIKYAEEYSLNVQAYSSDKGNTLIAILGADQIPFTGFTKYLIDTNMKVTKTFTSAQILQSNTTPLEIVPAQGPGKIIVPLLFITRLKFGTIAYATNTSMQYRINNISISGLAMILSAAVNRLRMKAMPDTTVDTTDLANQPLMLQTDTGNPTAGDGTLEVTVIYTIHTVS